MTITAQKIRSAAVLLQVVRPDRDDSVCMEATQITKKPECGTVACFGGFCELAFRVEENTVSWKAYPEFPWSVLVQNFADGTSHLSVYNDGARKLARHLGFDTRDDLENWACANPSIWGNACGGNMFFAAAAFGVENDGQSFDLQHIIDHLNGVADRLEAKERIEQ